MKNGMRLKSGKILGSLVISKLFRGRFGPHKAKILGKPRSNRFFKI
jgi:hypothetical protein